MTPAPTHDEDDTVNLEASARRSLTAPAGATLVIVALLVAGCSSSKGSTATKPTSAANSSTPSLKLLNKGLQEQAQGQTEQAKRDFQALVVLDPKNKLGYYNLGVIAQLAGDDVTAADDYGKTLKIDPRYELALYNLAILTDKKGDPAGAVDLYRRAIAINAKDANAHFNLGLLLQRRGKAGEGVTEINKAIALDPSLKRPPAPAKTAAPIPTRS